MCSVVAIDNPLGCGGIMQTLALGHACEATGRGREISAQWDWYMDNMTHPSELASARS